MLSLDNGVKYKDLLFDPSRRVRGGVVLISHAHSDHARPHDTTTIMTPETAKLTGFNSKTLSYGESMKIGEFEITSYPAGHIIGSTQYLVTDGKSIVYTGDFRMHDSILLSGAEPIDCDELVIESTFGSPEFVFPDVQEVYERFGKWVSDNYSKGKIVLIGAYQIGKAQEITKVLNEYADVLPLVHPKIKKLNDLTVASGVDIGEYFSFDSEEGRELLRHSFVGVVPTKMISKTTTESVMMQTGKEVVACVVTGWAKLFKGIKAFPLSDHADFNQLVEYVKYSEPKKVYTVHGFTHELARALRKEGFDARPLEKVRQASLDMFF